MRAGAWCFATASYLNVSPTRSIGFWGPPEFVRIKRAMKDAMVAHGNGPKLLDRSVQPIYKMKNLASLLAAEGGDEIVMKRLEISTLQGILNSIAIDSMVRIGTSRASRSAV